MKQLNWADFDACVQVLTERYGGRSFKGVYAVWVSKAPPQWWDAAEVILSSEWLLFPWENAAAALADESNYRQSRLDF